MITKHDTEMFHHEFWKPIYFGVKRSKVKVAGVGHGALVRTGFFYFSF